jgi:hypothetical protein
MAIKLRINAAMQAQNREEQRVQNVTRMIFSLIFIWFGKTPFGEDRIDPNFGFQSPKLFDVIFGSLSTGFTKESLTRACWILGSSPS